MTIPRLFVLPALLLLASQNGPFSPEPAKDLQAERLKVIKDLFKDDYARRAPADQQALAQKLFQQGVQTADDPASRFVLLREARDIAAAAGDLDTSLRAVDEIAKTFAVDAVAMKTTILAKASSSAKDPETARGIARAYLTLVQQAIRADDFDGAAAAAGKAETAAKAGQDIPLLLRTQEAKKEASSLKEEYQKVKGVLDKPGPADQETVGRYLCFVKGDWERGLPLLVTAAKPPLQTLAEKDLAKPVEADKQVELGDGWWETAQKEKSPWRKQRILIRAQGWFDQALPGVTGLTQTRVAKRVSELEELLTGAIDLLHMIDVKKDLILGEWSFEGLMLISPQMEWSRVQIPYAPPDEYDLTVVTSRTSGGDCIAVGLGRGSTNFAAVIEGHPAEGGMSAFDLLDGVLLEKHPDTVKGKFLVNGKIQTLVYSVRKGGVTVSVDGKTILSYQGSYTRLASSPSWKARDPKFPLFVGAYGTQYRFYKILLTPVSGQGKKLR